MATSSDLNDTADLSDHGLQALKVRLGQWQSFTGMEHGALHATAIHMHMAKSLVRWWDVRTGSRSLNFFQAVST